MVFRDFKCPDTNVHLSYGVCNSNHWESNLYKGISFFYRKNLYKNPYMYYSDYPCWTAQPVFDLLVRRIYVWCLILINQAIQTEIVGHLKFWKSVLDTYLEGKITDKRESGESQYNFGQNRVSSISGFRKVETINC
jgi:hypothetical protein